VRHVIGTDSVHQVARAHDAGREHREQMKLESLSGGVVEA